VSNAFAIGAVSAVLKNLLDNAVIHEPLVTSLGNVFVSAVAPDIAKAAGSDKVRLNLFLYHVEPNQGWRNEAMPSRDAEGRRITNAPLALDLFYLITANGLDDIQAEILLGYAAQLLHEVPVLTRDAIRATFSGPLVPPLTTLATSGIAEQIEQIKITPHLLNSEESSKLWSALQSSYRPSIAYRISVVLIEAKQPARTPLPVLRRAPAAIPQLLPPYPTLTAIVVPKNEPAAMLGEAIVLEGHDLSGIGVKVWFASPRLNAPLSITPAAIDVQPEKIKVTLPNLPADWPAGNWSVWVEMTKYGQKRTSNSLPLAIVPKMHIAANHVDADPTRIAGTVTIKLKALEPHVLPLQTASLVVGDREAQSNEHAAKTQELTFVYAPAVAPDPGTHLLRLRIDGVESRLVLRDVVPPQFDQDQKLTIP
jgi:hypothetical protein